MVTLQPVLLVVLGQIDCFMRNRRICRISLINTRFIHESDVAPTKIVSCAVVRLLCMNSSTLDGFKQFQFLSLIKRFSIRLLSFEVS